MPHDFRCEGCAIVGSETGEHPLGPAASPPPPAAARPALPPSARRTEALSGTGGLLHLAAPSLRALTAGPKLRVAGR